MLKCLEEEKNDENDRPKKKTKICTFPSICLIGFSSTKDFNKPSLKFEPRQTFMFTIFQANC
jgi:hypothetical protein